MSINLAKNQLPDLNELERRHISRITKALKDSQERRERERNWREYTSKDGSLTISYEVVDESYDDEFGRVEKKSVHVRKAVADVTLDENYAGVIEDLRIEIEAEENDDYE